MSGENGNRTKPTKALKRIIFARDKGVCRLCNEKVDPFNFEIGHDLAHSKGGKLTIQNAILLCALCNKSMRTMTLKQARKALGVKSSEEDSKKALKKLSIKELKLLAKNHRIKLKDRVIEGFWSDKILPPSKLQYINALTKELNSEQIFNEIEKITKVESNKKKGKN